MLGSPLSSVAETLVGGMVATVPACVDMGKGRLLHLSIVPTCRSSSGGFLNVALPRSAGTASACSGLVVGVPRDPSSCRWRSLCSSSADGFSGGAMRSVPLESARGGPAGCTPSCRSALSPSRDDMRRGPDDDSTWGGESPRIPSGTRGGFPLEGQRTPGLVRGSRQGAVLGGGGQRRDGDKALMLAEGGGAVDFNNDESDAEEVYNGWEVTGLRSASSRKRSQVIDVAVDDSDGGHVGPSFDTHRLRMLTETSVPETNGNAPPAIGETKMLAAVDMGTNSFHMVVVRADAQGRFQIVDVEKDDVRLGRGSTNMNVITPDAEERAIAAIKRFQKIAKMRKAEMRVVATSAVREARNRRTFIDRIYSATGLNVEVLSGREEAYLIYQGILQAMPIYEKTVLTVDIGGGSTEFVVGKAGKPLFATSLKLGHIRLSERCLGGGKVVEKGQIDELRRQIRIVLADSGVVEAVRNHKIDVAIGSSGTIETIVEMIHQDTMSSNSALLNGQGEKGEKSKQWGEKEKGEKGDKSKQAGEKGDKSKIVNAFKEKEFTKEELAQVIRKLGKARTLEQRMKLPGLSERRADVIVGGAILLEEIFAGLGIERMRVSPYALREGVIVDTLACTFDDYNPSTDIRRSSVLSLARRFNIDRRKASARHSAMLARQILAGLQTCRSGGRECMTDAASELDETDAELMEAATILHYVGMFISHKGYHKHSHYLIKNNEHLLGYSPMEIEIIALLARYHRKKVPSTKDVDFAKLPKDIQAKICSMCAVMRVAVALDRCDSGAVEVVHVLQDDNSCILAVTPQVDPVTGIARDVDLEMWAARSELTYFEKVFNRPTSIVIADRMDLDSLQEDGSISLSS